MVEKRVYQIIATFGALFIYLFFVYTLVDFIKSKKIEIQDFGYNVDDAIVVEIKAEEDNKPIEKKIEKPVPTPTPVKKPQLTVPPVILPPEPEVTPEPPKPIIEKAEPIKETVQEQKESRDKVAKSAKDLFSTIRTEKYDKVLKERQKQDAVRASRLKKQKAKQAQKRKEAQRKRRQKALAQAKEAMQALESSTAASHKKSGQEDAFWSPVSNRIQALWNRTIQTQDGLNADVKITIDNQGRVTYRIKRLSNNTLFDKKLKIFLQNLEYESFPKYHGGKSTSRVILFEDQESL